MPTAQEITQMQCPYLDASIEELFRVSLTAPACARMAMRDTQILGQHIPKGTIVFMVWNRADYVAPGFTIEESLRSESCRAAEKRVGVAGDAFDTAAFKPERWLAKSEDGKEVFDATRGRNMIFSLGPRGCFGRRLAYVEFRMLVVLVVWNFQLNELPAEFNTTKAYDKLTRQPQDCYVKLSVV
jgi:cytochrome P450